MSVLLKHGFVNYNIKNIPKIINKIKYNYGDVMFGDIYINSPIQIDLEIGGLPFVLEAGEYMIPHNIRGAHNLKILTNDDSVQIYHECSCDSEYKNMVSLLNNYLVKVESLKYKNKNNDNLNYNTVFYACMCDVILDNMLYINKKVTFDDEFINHLLKCEPVKQAKVKTYDQVINDIIDYNKKIDYYVENKLFEFVEYGSVEFTEDMYKKLK